MFCRLILDEIFLIKYGKGYNHDYLAITINLNARIQKS